MSDNATSTAKKKGRVETPNFQVMNHGFDARKAQLDELDKSEPDFVHMYAQPTATQKEISVKHQEFCMGANGEPLNHQGDPIVKMPKDMLEARQRAEGEFSVTQLEKMKALKRGRGTVKRSPKKPIIEED